VTTCDLEQTIDTLAAKLLHKILLRYAAVQSCSTLKLVLRNQSTLGMLLCQ